MISAELGKGKHRIGKSDNVILSVSIPEQQLNAMLKLRVVKGLSKSEIVTLALDLALALPPDEIARRIEERRQARGSKREEV